MSLRLSSNQINKFSGFGKNLSADGYHFRPSTLEGIVEVLALAKESDRKVVQRGSGKSYGDANILAEGIVLDLSRFNRILNWDPSKGILDAEAGVTIEQVWRATLEDCWWPPVVSGTMTPTLGGAIAMNIHGKNNFCAGTLADHVLELDLMDSNGKVHTLLPNQPDFKAVVAGMGLLGVITRVRLQMHKVASGNLKVVAVPIKNFEHLFSVFEENEHSSDYMVSWVDCFGAGNAAGRGLFHLANYQEIPNEPSLKPQNQDLPDSILGLIPKSVVWRLLKVFNNRAGMRFINAAKYYAGVIMPHGAAIEQSLVGFSFLLDYVPNWDNAYQPGGLIQFQAFVPKDTALQTFKKLVEVQQEHKLESFLGVFKRHRPDSYLLSHALDGYSLALDFKVTDSNRSTLDQLFAAMKHEVLAAGGRFYFAKDSVLTAEESRAFLGTEAIANFQKLRLKYDSSKLFSSTLAQRVGLDE